LAKPNKNKPFRDRVREQSRDVYRTAILEAAEVCFSQGLDATKISSIAAQAGVAVGTVYNYFENKDEIFRSLLDLRGAGFLAALDDIFFDPSAPLDELRSLITASLAYIESHRATYAVFVELGGKSEGSIRRIGGEQAQSLYEEYLERFTRAIAGAQEANLVDAEVGVDDLVALLTGAMNGVIARWIGTEDSTPLVRRSSLIFDHFLSGARTR